MISRRRRIRPAGSRLSRTTGLLACGIVLSAATGAQVKPAAPAAAGGAAAKSVKPGASPSAGAATTKAAKPGTNPAPTPAAAAGKPVAKAAVAPAPPAGKAPAPVPAAGIAPAPPAEVQVVRPSRPLGAVTALTFSPDGKRLAVGTYGQVVIFDAASWQAISTLHGVEDSARALAFDAAGATLAVGCGEPGMSGKALLWKCAGAEPAKALPEQYDTVESIAFDAEGKQVLFGADDNKARFLKAIDGKDGSLLDSHNGRVTAVAFSPKENTVFITGGLDKIVKVWDWQKVQNVVNFDQSEAGITGLAFLPNGTQFVGSSLDGKLYWWGVGFNNRDQTWGGYHYRTVGAHDGGVYTLAGSANGQRIITSGADSTVKIWNIDNGGQIREIKDAGLPMYAVALSPDGKTAAGGGRDGMVRIWSVETGKLTAAFAPPALPAPAKAPAKAKSAVHRGRVAKR